MSLKCFVASSFLARESVLAAHDQLRERGITPVSSWPTASEPPPDASADWFFTLPLHEQREIVARNDADLASAHVVLLLADPRGRESFAEAARALQARMPVIWLGFRTTSAIREGVVWVGDSFARALMMLESMSKIAAQSGVGDADVRATCWRMATGLLQEAA